MESKDEPVYIPVYGDFTINPMRNHSLSYHHFSRFIFDSLFTLTERLEPVPSIVESYSYDQEGKRLHLKLYKDVLWHDGERLTTEDIAFTIGVHHYALLNLKEEELSEYIPFAGDVRFVEILDELNCDLVFNSPSSLHLSRLTFPLIPAHAYEGEEMEKYRQAMGLEQFLPIGCGPYKLSSQGKDEIQLEKFRYHRDSSHHLKKIYGRIMSSDVETTEMLEQKKINFAEVFELNIDKYEKNDMIKSVDFVSCEYEFLAFNYENSLFQGNNGQRMRQIIASLIPQKEIVRRVLLGGAIVSNVPVSPSSYLYTEGKTETVGKKEMVRFLHEIGYAENEDGWFVGEDGEALKFRLIAEDDPVRRAAVGLIVNSFENVGVHIETSFLNQNDEEWKKTLEARRYDLAWVGVVSTGEQDLSLFFNSSSPFYIGTNILSESQLEATWQMAEAAYDEEQKMMNYKMLQEIIRKEVPHVGLFFRKRSLVSTKDFIGNSLPDMFDPYRGISTLIYTN